MKSYNTWKKLFIDHLVSDYYLEFYYHPALKTTSEPGEDIRDFKIRLSHFIREERDEAVTKLQDRFGRRIQTLQGRIQRAEERVEREKSQSTQQKLSAALSIGSTIFGVLLGRKKISGSTISKAGTAVRSAGKVIKESGDISRAKQNLIRLNDQLIDLQDKLQDEIDLLDEKFDQSSDNIEVIKIRPRKTNISVKLFNFVWIPIGDETLRDIKELELV